MKPTMNFYLFKGPWIEHYDEIAEMTDPSKNENFAFWEAIDKTREFTLLILYNKSLTDSFCYRRDIWISSEPVFNKFYRDNKDQYTIHGFNESANAKDRYSFNALLLPQDYGFFRDATGNLIPVPY